MCNTLPEGARCLFSVGGDVVVLKIYLSAHGTIIYDQQNQQHSNTSLATAVTWTLGRISLVDCVSAHAR